MRHDDDFIRIAGFDFLLQDSSKSLAPLVELLVATVNTIIGRRPVVEQIGHEKPVAGLAHEQGCDDGCKRNRPEKMQGRKACSHRCEGQQGRDAQNRQRQQKWPQEKQDETPARRQITPQRPCE